MLHFYREKLFGQNISGCAIKMKNNSEQFCIEPLMTVTLRLKGLFGKSKVYKAERASFEKRDIKSIYNVKRMVFLH